MHKRIITLLIGISCYSIAFTQTLLNEWKEPAEEHQLIKGTNLYMIPPVGFTDSENFKGLQRPDDPTSMIMIMEIPGPFTDVIKGFNEEMMAPRGMTLIDRKEVWVNGMPGILIDLEQGSAGLVFSKSILVYGTESATTMVNGIFLKDSTALGEQIHNSVLSVFVDNQIELDPRKEVSFDVDETAGNLLFNTVVGNGLLFTRDGKTPTESPDKLILIVDKSFSKETILDQKQFCLTRLASYADAFILKEGMEMEAVELDGLKGYSLFAKNLTRPKEELYQVILFGEEGGYFILSGSYLKEMEQSRKDILAVIQTFKRK